MPIEWSDAGHCVEVVVLLARTGDGRLPVDLLSEDERARANAFRRDEDRRNSVAASLLVRFVAGTALGMAPGAVTVTRRCPNCRGAHGPPYVARGPFLSVSHCEGYAVVAASSVPVGVDVEPASQRGLAHLASLILGPEESRCDDDASLLRVWVRKEATLKATGVGLSVLPAAIQVAPASESATVVHYGPQPGLAIGLADLSQDELVGSVAALTNLPLNVCVQDATETVAAL